MGSSKYTVKKMKRQASNWEKIFATHNQLEIFRTELLQISERKTNNLTKKGQKKSKIVIFQKRKHKLLINTKFHSTSLVIRKIKSQTTTRNHYSLQNVKV